MRHKNMLKQLIVSKGKGEDVQNRWAAKSLIWCNIFFGFAYIAFNLDSILFVYFECEKHHQTSSEHQNSFDQFPIKSWHSDLIWWGIDEEDSPNTWTCVGLHIFDVWQSPKKCHSDGKSSHWLADCQILFFDDSSPCPLFNLLSQKSV